MALRLAMTSAAGLASSSGPRARRGAASPQEQDVAPGERLVQVGDEIADQPGAIGVVAEDAAIREAQVFTAPARRARSLSAEKYNRKAFS